MDFLCLAAGEGTRFGQLGRYLQKCMYPVGLEPFVACSVRNLLATGLVQPDRDRLAFVVGHHAEQVEAYFGADVEGVPVRYVEQAEARGTGHAVALAARALAPGAPALVWLADTYLTPAMARALIEHPSDNAITVAPSGDDANTDVRVSRAADGRVERAWQGREAMSDIGAWKLAPPVMARLDAVATNEIRLLPNLQREIDAGLAVGSVEAPEWLHLGGTEPTPEANVLGVIARVLELEGRSPTGAGRFA